MTYSFSEFCGVCWPLRYQIPFPFGEVMLAVVLSVSLLDAVLAARRPSREAESQSSTSTVSACS